MELIGYRNLYEPADCLSLEEYQKYPTAAYRSLDPDLNYPQSEFQAYFHYKRLLSLKQNADLIDEIKTIHQGLIDPGFEATMDYEYSNNFCDLYGILDMELKVTSGWGWKCNKKRYGNLIDFDPDELLAMINQISREENWPDDPSSRGRIKLINVPTEQDNVVSLLNTWHAAVLHGSKFVILRETHPPGHDSETDPLTGKRIKHQNEVSFMSREDFRSWYECHKIDNPLVTIDRRVKKKLSYGDIWLNSSNRRSYRKVVFDPSEKHDDLLEYNLYQGLAIEPVKGDWSLTRKHIKEIICRGNKKHYKWFRARLAKIAQDPGGKKPGTAIVLRGPEGCGKGIIFNNFGKIFGHHHFHLINQVHLTGRFNDHLALSVFVFMDEGFWTGNKSDESILKGLITEESFAVEGKYRDVIQVNSHLNIAIASNSDWVVPAGFESRRFAIYDVSDEKCGDRQYFNDIADELENGGLEAMLYDLLKMDISGVDLRTPPRTGALVDQILYSLSDPDKFWLERLQEGEILPGDGSWRDGQPIEIQNIYGSFEQFQNQTKSTRGCSLVQLSKRLSALCPGIHRERPPVNGKKVSCLIFPPLDECRKSFEAKIKKEIDWS